MLAMCRLTANKSPTAFLPPVLPAPPSERDTSPPPLSLSSASSCSTVTAQPVALLAVGAEILGVSSKLVYCVSSNLGTVSVGKRCLCAPSPASGWR